MTKLSRQFKESLRLLLLVGVVIGAIGALSATAYYLRFEALVVADLKRNAMNTAAVVAVLVEENAEDYRALSEIKDYGAGEYDRAYYERMLGVFRHLKREIRADFIFTEKYLSDRQVAYVLDAEDPNSERFSPLGTVDTCSAEERQAFLENANTATGLMTDPAWGEYLSGFAPIHDPKTGEVLGVVGVDYSAGHVRLFLKDVLRTIVWGTILGVFGIALTIFQLIRIGRKAQYTDYLTRLGSRRYFEKSFSKLFQHADRPGFRLCLMMIDIDDFSKINNTYGHQAGDQALIRLAHILKGTTRENDVVARFGGDEFVCVMPDTDLEQGLNLVRRIIDNVACKPMREGDSEPVRMTVSVGIAEYKPGMPQRDLIRLADARMYQAKSAGKNRVVGETTD